MKKSIKKVKKQCTFCEELMNRLNEDIQCSNLYNGTICKHSQIKQDVIRLRRELMELSYMLDEWGYEE